MTVKDLSKLSIRELWCEVALSLKLKGIDTVLVGGGVATIYSEGSYMSGDLDFVMGWRNNHKEIKEALMELGFKKTGRIYTHPDVKFTLDFTSPPVEVGDKNDPEIVEEIYNGEVIRILSPTESIKDRLNKYVHFNDGEAFFAAIEVAKKAPYSILKIEKFCRENSYEHAYLRFRSELKV